MKNINKIRTIIEENFDTRLELSVLYYILEAGTDQLKKVTEEDITQIKGDALMSNDFCQALVRTAVLIAKEFDTIDIMTFIRCKANFFPSVNEITFFSDDYSIENWKYLLNKLDISYEDSIPRDITLWAIDKHKYEIS